MWRLRLSILLLAICASTALGSGRKDAAIEGNTAFISGDYDSALMEYEKAAVDNPESPYLLFNKGAAHYKLDDLEKAKEFFSQAAIKAQDLDLEAKAFYNLGNTVFRQAEKLVQEDLEKAIAGYEDCLLHYRRALQIKSDYSDAAHNTEVTRLVLKDLLDRLKKQQEEQAVQQEALAEIIRRLQELMEEESGEISDNRELSAMSADADLGEELKKRILELKSKQETTLGGSAEVSSKLKNLSTGGGTPGNPAGPVQEALDHLNLSMVEQGIAVSELGSYDLSAAMPSQESALEELFGALQALTDESPQSEEGQAEEDTEPQEAGSQGESENENEDEEDAAAAVDEQAKDIVDEERENREQRVQAQARYQDVERDW